MMEKITKDIDKLSANDLNQKCIVLLLRQKCNEQVQHLSARIENQLNLNRITAIVVGLFLITSTIIWIFIYFPQFHQNEFNFCKLNFQISAAESDDSETLGESSMTGTYSSVYTNKSNNNRSPSSRTGTNRVSHLSSQEPRTTLSTGSMQEQRIQKEVLHRPVVNSSSDSDNEDTRSEYSTMEMNNAGVIKQSYRKMKSIAGKIKTTALRLFSNIRFFRKKIELHQQYRPQNNSRQYYHDSSDDDNSNSRISEDNQNDNGDPLKNDIHNPNNTVLQNGAGLQADQNTNKHCEQYISSERVQSAPNDHVEMEINDLEMLDTQRKLVKKTFDNVQNMVINNRKDFCGYRENLLQIITPHLVYRYYVTLDWEKTYHGKRYDDAIIASLKWRKEQGFLGKDLLQPLNDHDEILPYAKKGVIYVSNRVDKRNRAILYARVGRIEGQLSLKISQQLVYQNVERASQYSVQKGSGEFVVIIDLKDFTWEACPQMTLVKQVLTVLKLHYPYRVYANYLVNAGAAFLMLWNTVRPLLPEKVRDKTFVLSTNNMARVLQRKIGKTNLETEFGGDILEQESIML